MVKRQLAVVYVDVDKILFYVKGAKNSLQLNLPSDVVSDLEIIGREKFDELVDTFFQMKSLRDIGFDIILVFSQGFNICNLDTELCAHDLDDVLNWNIFLHRVTNHVF